jgi:hypothetical protein
VPEVGDDEKEEFIPPHELSDRITAMRREMMEMAEKLDYERAAELRDQIKKLERKAFGMDAPRMPPKSAPGIAHGSQRQRREDASAAKTRGRRGAGAVTGAASAIAASGKPARKQGRLSLIPDHEK